MKVFKREIVKNLRLYGQLHRFLPELASAIGVKLAEVPVNDRTGYLANRNTAQSPALHGRTRFDHSHLFIDLFHQPDEAFRIHWHYFAACLVWLSVVVLAGTKIYHGIIGGWSGFQAYQIGNRPLLLLAILLIVIGVQLLMMGFLGEMIMRIYYESRDKPIYNIRQILD